MFDILSLVSRILELTDSLGRDLTKLNTTAYITVCQVINELVTKEKKRKEKRGTSVEERFRCLSLCTGVEGELSSSMSFSD